MKYALCLALALATASAVAQLSSPLPAGSGPGVHSPDSPFKPLPQRSDVIAWSTLTAVKTRTVKNRVLPAFQPEQMQLDQTTQRLQGFMMPLQAGEKHTHFLLSSVPLTCGFCVPGGPESMVEVRSREPVRYTLEPVVVEGKFAVLPDDPHGLFYRITGAVGVK
jgi:uncharacterized protein